MSSFNELAIFAGAGGVNTEIDSIWIDVSQSPIVDWEMWQGRRRYKVLMGNYALMAIRTASEYFMCVATVSDDGGLIDMDGNSVGYEAEDVTFYIPISEPSINEAENGSGVEIHTNIKNHTDSGWYWAKPFFEYSITEWIPVYIDGEGYYLSNGSKKPVSLLASVDLHKAVMPKELIR